MPWWTWIAVGFLGVVLVAGAVFALVTARALSSLEATGDRVAAALEELAAKSEALERRSAHVEERRAAAQAHFDHLSATLERFSVLRWALGDATKTVADVRGALLVRK